MNRHPNEAFIDLNLRSDLLNKSAIAKKLGLTPQNFSDKLNGRGKAKPFTTAELIDIEYMVKTDLNITGSVEFKNIPLENLNDY